MERIEQIELDHQRRRIVADVRKLVEKYRSIFTWDVPDIDQAAADRVLLAEIRRALDEVERTTPRHTPPRE